MPERKSYEESCAHLIRVSVIEPPSPPLPSRLPRHDDEEPLGLSFGRAGLADADLSSLTLPRTYFGRTLVERTSFANCDLHESSMCWSDFTDVDFADADLSLCDMRASQFERVSFQGANLDRADFRHSWFADCSFIDARMMGVILTCTQGGSLQLSSRQQAEIDWRDADGGEPEGG